MNKRFFFSLKAEKEICASYWLKTIYSKLVETQRKYSINFFCFTVLCKKHRKFLGLILTMLILLQMKMMKILKKMYVLEMFISKIIYKDSSLYVTRNTLKSFQYNFHFYYCYFKQTNCFSISRISSKHSIYLLHHCPFMQSF